MRPHGKGCVLDTEVVEHTRQMRCISTKAAEQTRANAVSQPRMPWSSQGEGAVSITRALDHTRREALCPTGAGTLSRWCCSAGCRAGSRNPARTSDQCSTQINTFHWVFCVSRCECFGSTFRPKPGWLECLQKLQDNIMLNNKLSQLSRG